MKAAPGHRIQGSKFFNMTSERIPCSLLRGPYVPSSAGSADRIWVMEIRGTYPIYLIDTCYDMGYNYTNDKIIPS